MKVQKINKVSTSIQYFCINCGHFHCEKNKKWGCIHSTGTDKEDYCNCHKFVGRKLKGKFS